MPELLLLRHAKSDWKDNRLDDHDRPLAPRGLRAASRVGRFLREKGLEPDLVLCSTALRARETLDLVLTALASKPEISYLKTLYLAPPSRLLDILRRQNPETGRILLIGHNPGLERLALGLAQDTAGPQAGPARRMAEKYPTAALTELAFENKSWAEIGPGTGDAVRFVAPRSLV